MFRMSKHSRMRSQQRGLHSDDAQFVCEHGTETPEGFMLTNEDAIELVAEAKFLLEKAQRLRGGLRAGGG